MSAENLSGQLLSGLTTRQLLDGAVRLDGQLPAFLAVGPETMLDVLRDVAEEAGGLALADEVVAVATSRADKQPLSADPLALLLLEARYEGIGSYTIDRSAEGQPADSYHLPESVTPRRPLPKRFLGVVLRGAIAATENLGRAYPR